MTDRELLELLVTEIKDLKVGQQRMEGEFKSLKSEVGDMKAEVGEVKAEVRGVKSDVCEVKAGQIRMENKFDEKNGALTDAFELRGDQIERLQEHLDERLDSIENDLSFVVGKLAQHDRNFIQIRKNSKTEKI